MSKSGAERQRRYRAAHPERRLRKYGLTAESYSRLLTSQENTCAICREPFDMTNLKSACVDHDHESGRVRGILCRSCNLALGNMGDNPATLRAAAIYLERWSDVS